VLFELLNKEEEVIPHSARVFTDSEGFYHGENRFIFLREVPVGTFLVQGVE